MAKAVITDYRPQKVSSIKNTDYSRAKVYDEPNRVRINYDLPFRVKFINIGLDAYGPNNPAPIGIAIIGFNNYIL